MNMTHMTRKFVAVAVAAVIVTASGLVPAEQAARPVGDYTVFVDPPTGFVFIKLPAGWKYVDKVDARDVARLPATVVTSLLTGEDDHDAMENVAASRSASASRR